MGSQAGRHGCGDFANPMAGSPLVMRLGAETPILLLPLFDLAYGFKVQGLEFRKRRGILVGSTLFGRRKYG